MKSSTSLLFANIRGQGQFNIYGERVSDPGISELAGAEFLPVPDDVHGVRRDTPAIVEHEGTRSLVG